MSNANAAWNAEDYAQHSSGQYRLAQELITKLSLQAHHHVLDIGCGDGKITRQLAEVAREGQVVGIDYSDSMICYAQGHHTLNNLQFRQMDARDIQLSGCYDRIFSNAALHWVDDQLAVLQGIRRLIAPGGKILLQMGGVGNAQLLINAIQAVQQLSTWQSYYQHFKFPYTFPSPQQYQLWLQTAGFSIIRIELLDRIMEYDNIEGLIGWLRSAWFPMVEPLPADRRTEFWQAVCELYLAEAVHKDTIRVAMKRPEVEARVLL